MPDCRRAGARAVQGPKGDGGAASADSEAIGEREVVLLLWGELEAGHGR